VALPPTSEIQSGCPSAARSGGFIQTLRNAAASRWRTLNPVVTGSIVLSTGTILGGAAITLSAPIITRLYGPSNYGMLAVYASLLALATPLASLSYEMAIPIEKEDGTAANLAAVSLAIAFLIAGAVAFFSIGPVDLIPKLTKTPGLRPYLLFLPIAFAFTAVYQVLNSWALRTHAFARIARTRATQSIGSATVQLSVGAVTGSPWGLFAGDLVGRAGGTGVLFKHALRTWPSGSVSVDGVKYALRRYARFPLFASWAAVLTMAGTQLPVLMLSRYFGLEIAGWYALTSRVLGTPNSLVGQTLGQAFLARAARLGKQEHNLRELTEATTGWVFLAGLPLFTFITLEGPRLFATLFGPRWAVSGTYAQRLAPLAFIWFVASPISSLLNIREWQRATLAFSLAECAVTLLALYAGLWRHSPEFGITLLGIGMFVLTAINMELGFRAGYTSWMRLVKLMAPLFACAAFASTAVFLAIQSSTIGALTSRFLLFSALYFLLVWMCRLYPSASWKSCAA